MRIKGFAGAFVAALAMSVGVSGVAVAAPAEPLSGAAVFDANLTRAVNTLEPYMEVNNSGAVRIDAPADVLAGVDPTAYDALSVSLDVYNTVLATEDVDPAIDDDPAFPEAEVSAYQNGFQAKAALGKIGPFIKFVQKFWGAIVKAAKKSGKWAWYKSARCANGAVDLLWDVYDDAHDLAIAIAENYKIPLGVAITGCIRRL